MGHSSMENSTKEVLKNRQVGSKMWWHLARENQGEAKQSAVPFLNTAIGQDPHHSGEREEGIRKKKVMIMELRSCVQILITPFL